MERKALCQQDPGQDQDFQPMEDQAKYDSALKSSAGDLVADLTAVLSADFALPFHTISPLISKFDVRYSFRPLVLHRLTTYLYGKTCSLSDQCS